MASFGQVQVETTGREQYRALAFRRILILVALTAALCFSISADMALGPANYALSDVLSALFDPAAAANQLRVIIWDIRMPIALMAVTVGASLSVAGAQMQTILSNPLASPFTLGISAAASFGAALALVGGVAIFPGAIEYMVPLNAFLMAMAAALFIHFASTMRGVSVETIVLLGIALVFTFNAALSLLEYLASEQALAAVVFWTMGSLTKATWAKVYFTAAVLAVTVPLFMRQAWALTALRLGDDKAASLGINVRRLRLQTMMIVSLLAAIPVSFVGTIGFVGLVGPHIARMVVGEDQRFFLPGSVICGALLLSVTSVVSKILIPGAILPIGVITALVGVPFFFILIFSNRRRAW
ncbi:MULTISPECIES: FecCD family ABC transporter permease [Rhizobium]|uniref:ABC transporter, membrane spanning protein n=1 Tax=Rhizobium favelukesii TaxID=348824 RepID=W6R9B7_9HYPH|nr:MULTISPECIES: iron ABC transporter permease [Rhizobium]MCA0802134.1 iron ABC transporter permease [Rhizobium sp. T1473]MCS0458762.1 iron ABC transporter permease [Rhizobium favelukesii]UFS80689.1 iron ABC transporter permease [Rhizobium sp. T136]CDM57867.1 ABC transporter, membrane spanning protein [Rhizobium favelukesii]